MLALQIISTQAAEDIATPNLKEVIDFVSNRMLPTGNNDVFITFIICCTVAVCLAIVAIAVSYCVKQNTKAKLEDLKSRQEFEKTTMLLEQEAMAAKWQHEDQVRQQEHNWKIEEGQKLIK